MLNNVRYYSDVNQFSHLFRVKYKCIHIERMILIDISFDVSQYFKPIILLLLLLFKCHNVKSCIKPKYTLNNIICIINVDKCSTHAIISFAYIYYFVFYFNIQPTVLSFFIFKSKCYFFPQIMSDFLKIYL